MDKELIRQKTTCFTGHRDIPANEVKGIEARTEHVIQQLYDKGVRYFGVGGALGYDTLAADVLFRLRGSYMPDIKIILVYPFDGFTNRWKPAEQARHDMRLPYYNKVVKVSEKQYRGETVGEVVAQYYNNSYASLVSQFVEEDKMDLQELKDLIARIESQRKK